MSIGVFGSPSSVPGSRFSVVMRFNHSGARRQWKISHNVRQACSLSVSGLQPVTRSLWEWASLGDFVSGCKPETQTGCKPVLLQALDVEGERFDLRIVQDAVVDGHAGVELLEAFDHFRAGVLDGFLNIS